MARACRRLFAGPGPLALVAPSRIAASRRGKGVDSMIPNRLVFEGSMLVLDVKGDTSLGTGHTTEDPGHD